MTVLCDDSTVCKIKAACRYKDQSISDVSAIIAYQDHYIFPIFQNVNKLFRLINNLSRTCRRILYIDFSSEYPI